MHPKAMEALKNKLEELISDYEFNTAFSVGFSKHLNSIASDIHKQKRDWISHSDAINLLLSEIIPKISSRLDAGPLFNSISPKTFAQSILAKIDQIPKPYILSLLLPSVKPEPDLNLTITDEISFKSVTDTHFFSRSSSILGGPAMSQAVFCLQINTSGYFQYNFSSESLHRPLSLLKVVIERCLFGSIFTVSSIPYSLYTNRTEASALDLSDNSPISVPLNSTDKNFIKNIKLERLPQKASLVSQVRHNHQNTSIEQCRRLLTTQNSNANRIIAASEWRYEALAEESPAMSLVKACVGLEAIFGEQNSEGGITTSLADRCAFSLARNHDERSNIIAKTKELYRLRSKIVHGVASRLNSDGELLLGFAKNLLGRAISSEIDML